jgi:phosphoribosylformimino-5-aminoimidazole carboxamide ribotide isomerase
LGGAAIDLYKKILTSSSSIKLVASGGVSTVDDLYLLQEAGCNGAIIGKAIYENRISLEDLKKFNYAH